MKNNISTTGIVFTILGAILIAAGKSTDGLLMMILAELIDIRRTN